MRIYRVITTQHDMKVGAALDGRHAVESAKNVYRCPDSAIKSVEYREINNLRWRYLYDKDSDGVFDSSMINEKW